MPATNCSRSTASPIASRSSRPRPSSTPRAATTTRPKSNLTSLTTLVDLARKNVELKQRDVDRKSKLVSSQAGSQADLDTAAGTLVTAQLQAQFAKQQRDTTLSSLLGNANLPLEQFPEYAQAKAAFDSGAARSTTTR